LYALTCVLGGNIQLTTGNLDASRI